MAAILEVVIECSLYVTALSVAQVLQKAFSCSLKPCCLAHFFSPDSVESCQRLPLFMGFCSSPFPHIHMK